MGKINKDLVSFIDSVDGLRNLVRYQTAPRISNETVAEHSYFVSVYILKLRDYFNFNLEKTLKMSLLHDYAECYISDVPHPIKRQFPEISTVLNNVEFDINKTHINEEFAKDILEFNKLTTIEGTMVALADIISVLTYSTYEMSLGNSKYMQTVNVASKERLWNIIRNIDDKHYISEDSKVEFYKEVNLL